jgi:serine/threonine protein phosphatase PrpC
VIEFNDLIKEEFKNKQRANQLNEAIKNGCLNLDKKLFKIADNKTIANQSIVEGLTVIACLISPEKIYLINKGLSKAILVNKQNQIKFTTVDRKKRLLSTDIETLNTTTASKKIENIHLKNKDLTRYEPYISTFDRNLQEDKFLIMANDIFWNHIDTNEVIKYVSDELELSSDLEEICVGLLNKIKNISDRMSLVLIEFSDNKVILKPIIKPARTSEFKINELETITKKFSNEFSKYALDLKSQQQFDDIIETFDSHLKVLKTTIGEFKSIDTETTNALNAQIINYKTAINNLSNENNALKQKIGNKLESDDDLKSELDNFDK